MQTLYTFSYTPGIATGTNTTGTNWRMAYQQPLMLYKGNNNIFRIVVFSTVAKVVNLTGYSVEIQLVDKESKTLLLTKSATITAPTSGVVTCEVTSEDLDSLNGRFYHLTARLIKQSDNSSEIMYIDDNYGAFTPVTIDDGWNFITPII